MSLRILIISQNKALCDSLARLLSSDGHEVSRLEGLAGDLKGVRSAKPDLIVLDVSSSASGAVDMVPRLQRTGEMRHIPVIVVTDSPSLQYELLSVFDCIPLPVDKVRFRDDVAFFAGGAGRRVLSPKAGPLSDSDFRLFYDYLVTKTGDNAVPPWEEVVPQRSRRARVYQRPGAVPQPVRRGLGGVFFRQPRRHGR